MKESFINAQQLPLIIEPNGNGTSKRELLHWINENRESVAQKFTRHGAILFRGFDIDTPNDFEDLAMQVDPRLESSYYGTSPRNLVKGTKCVFTASELPGYYPIPQHCEMSYATNPPINIFFYCHVEPDYGGESPICNFRKVYAELNSKIRDEFDKKGVITVRNYSGLGSKSRFNLFELKKWNEIFNTTEKAEVEKQCREQHIEFEWLDGGNLRLLHRTPAAIEHPVTSEKTWFNHLQVFHPHGADVEYSYIHHHQHRAKTFFWKNFIALMVKLKSRTAPMEQSMNVLFGDGTPIPDSYVEHVEGVIWKNMVLMPWKKKDVIALDNFSTAHGRMPYEGEREILVSWSTA
jgi:alpha-ketoglutarate-dependent taurine dioxygenase